MAIRPQPAGTAGSQITLRPFASFGRTEPGMPQSPEHGREGLNLQTGNRVGPGAKLLHLTDGTPRLNS